MNFTRTTKWVANDFCCEATYIQHREWFEASINIVTLLILDQKNRNKIKFSKLRTQKILSKNLTIWPQKIWKMWKLFYVICGRPHSNSIHSHENSSWTPHLSELRGWLKVRNKKRFETFRCSLCKCWLFAEFLPAENFSSFICPTNKVMLLQHKLSNFPLLFFRMSACENFFMFSLQCLCLIFPEHFW